MPDDAPRRRESPLVDLMLTAAILSVALSLGTGAIGSLLGSFSSTTGAVIATSGAALAAVLAVTAVVASHRTRAR